MAEPRVVSEQEIPQIPQIPRASPQQQRQPANMALIYQAIAMVLAAKLQCLLLVGAMIVLSYMAVSDPTSLRLYAAGGFDLLALCGLALLGRPAG